MRQHLIRVTLGADAFESLIDAIRKAGDRAGWLELGTDEADLAEPLPLGKAADLGVLRAVSVTDHRTVAVKPLRGAPVMKDLLREHFRGCLLVLIRGELTELQIDPAVPRLEPRGEGWLLQTADESDRELGTESLIAALRKPRPWN